MKITIRHHYDFGSAAAAVGADLVRPEAWDAAREIQGPFGLPASRPEWEQVAANRENQRRAADILHVADRLGAKSICSYGVGVGGVEFCMATAAPNLRMICTDFAPATVDRLRRLFPEAEVRQHDLRRESPIPADLHLMHRIDTELTKREWMPVFRTFGQPVIFVPAMTLDIGTLIRELGRRVLRRRLSRAGYLRSESALRELWQASHTDSPLRIGSLGGFLLCPRA